MRHCCWKARGFAVALAVVATVCAATISSATTGPNLRIQLVSQLGFGASVDYSDIWVWEDPVTMKRYAVLGEYPSVGAHLYIAEVTNPLNPVLVATISNVPGFDVKVRYPYLYAVDGDQNFFDGAIYDITDPANPAFVANMQSAHNVTIADNGYIYFSIPGLSVADLNPDPTNPIPLWDDNTPQWYFGHDVTVVGNRMYDFNGWSTATNIYDITAFNADTSLAPVLLKTLSDPFVVYSHNGWPTLDGNYLLVTDELSPANEPDLVVWDISDVANPAFTPTITDWYMDENSTIHNVMIRDNLAFVSYYAAGVKVFDVSTPGIVNLIDEYDTSALTGDGYVGAWGIHCLFGDYFYVSDMQNGLFIFELVPESSLWRENGIPVASDAHTGKLVPGGMAEPDYTVPDGSGGAVILFDPEGGNRDIYAQRVDVNGNCLWNLAGVPVIDAAGDVTLGDVIPDDNGGAIVLWTDANTTVYAQWIDENGAQKYAAGGLPISSTDMSITSTGMALHLASPTSFVAVWTELLGNTQLLCRAFDDTGTPVWGSATQLTSSTAPMQAADICTDGVSGFVVVWQDERNASSDIYGQHVNATGVVQWAGAGVPVAMTADAEASPVIDYVGGGRMTAAWTRQISGAHDHVVAGRISAGGTLDWTSTMSDTASNKRDLQLVSDGGGGVFAVWEDNRAGNWDIYAQRFHSAGFAVVGWPNKGLAVASSSLPDRAPTVEATNDNGLVVAWGQDPAGDGDIFATKLDGFGVPVWPAGTLAVCARPGTAFSPAMAVDSNGDVIIAWHDIRPEGAYAQRIEASCGTLGGNVPPWITTITDTPGDGGGFVDITWSAAGQDGAGMVVQDYDVLFAENPQFGWANTGVTVPATGQASYTATVPTAQDGTPTWYLVVANGGTSTCTWESFPSSGVSIDDPPSNAPQNLQVTPQSPDYLLTWEAPNPMAPDFSHYNVYRSAVSPAFVVGSAAVVPWIKIGESTDPTFLDNTAAPDTVYEWTVTAADQGGQESPYADPDTASGGPTGIDPPTLPVGLSGNFPNPFSSTTELRFSMLDPADVMVSVYDVAGRRVARMALGRLGPGEHHVPFDGSRLASGIYFYRVRIGSQTFTRKMGIRR